MLNCIFNEDCHKTLEKMIKGGQKVDFILTSPFYNTNYKAGKNRTLSNTNPKYYPYVRYDTYVDNITDEQYKNYILELFNSFNSVLNNNGVILWQVSYGSKGAGALLDLMSSIDKSNIWCCADIITWKKTTALPNSVSCNKCTRITEYVFVFCRKDEFYTYKSNKTIISERSNGQKQYSCFYNYIEARNNDGATELNKATFSTELVEKLIDFYIPKGSVVYDCFMGTGTTAVACKKKGISYIGSEISKKQCEYAEKRLKEVQIESK